MPIFLILMIFVQDYFQAIDDNGIIIIEFHY